MLTIITMLLPKYLSVLLFISLIACTNSESEKSTDTNKMVGGPCTYTEFRGTATITTIEDAPADDYNCANNPKLVSYSFTPNEAEASSDYKFTNVADSDQSLKILGGKNPAQTWLESNGVQIGNTYTCVRAEIQSGTCTPVIFTIKDLDLTNSAGCD
jgi:hypothetical protein